MKLLKKIASYFGPGFITGASDDDPSGITTYAQTGALFGFKQLWTAAFSFPLMATIQEMCGRIGCVADQGLASIIKKHYAKWVLYGSITLLFIANAINIGADLGAMAEAIELVIPGMNFGLSLVILITITLLLEIFVTYTTYARYLIFLACSLLAYVITTFFLTIDWKEVAIASLVPHIEFNQQYLLNITAIFGTTISPYMFFWQSDQEVEEKKADRVKADLCDQLSDARIDSITGMFFSNLIMWFIMVATGAAFFGTGVGEITSAAQAAKALKPLAGDYASLLFALGIIGTGLLAVPILAASTAYAICEIFDWPSGLSLKYHEGKAFYGIITVSVLMASLINFLPISSITLLYYTAIINGILAPPLLAIILLIANNPKIMGPYVNGKFSNILGGATCILMSVAAVALLISFF